MVSYFGKCNEAVSKWRARGPQLLEPPSNADTPGYPKIPLNDELEHPHGVYLFRHRNLPIRYFAPNFHPPYDTSDKREVIAKYVNKAWDEQTLDWVS
jgi:hypothetical protein